MRKLQKQNNPKASSRNAEVGTKKKMEESIMTSELFKKVAEMEKLAYADYTDAAERNGEESKRTQELKYRHLGILEVKRELMRSA